MDKIDEMFNFDKDYFSKLIGISKEIGGADMDFKDKNIEKKFKLLNLNEELNRSKKFSVYVAICYVISLAVNLQINNAKFVRSTYMLLCGISFEIFYAVAIYFIIKKERLSLHYYFKFLRYFTIQAIYFLIIIFPVNSLPLDYCIRNYSYNMVYFGLFQIFYLDFNYYANIFYPILNIIQIIYFQYKYALTPIYLFPEFCINIIFYIMLFQNRKSQLIIKKEIFYESNKNILIIDYIKNLIDCLTNMVISINKSEVKYMNKYAMNYFQNSIKKVSININEENDNINRMENEEIMSEIQNETEKNIYLDVKNFFDSLRLSKNHNSNGLSNEISLNQMITEFLMVTNVNVGETFKRLGFFNNKIKGVDNCFYIYIRKVNSQEEGFEILIYDVTEIKLAEKTKIETKYKQKILAKIAHEFKTPLITMISLIQKFKEEQNFTVDNNLLLKVNHVSNLSNYSVLLN